MTALLAQIGYVTAVVGGITAVGAMLYSTLAPLRGSRAAVPKMRRLVQFSGGVALVGMGLNIGISAAPLGVAWGALIVLIGGYFLRLALRRPVNR